MSGVPSLQISSRPPLPLRSDVAASAADVRITAAFRAHRDRLRSVLLRSGLGTGDAEDVTQEAFWVFAQRVSDVPEFAERAFLMNTALRLASDRRRSVWHHVTSHEWTADDWASSGANPEELCAGHDARRRLDAARRDVGRRRTRRLRARRARGIVAQ